MNAGFVREGQDIFAKYIQGYPEGLKNVRFFMSVWPFKDHQVLKSMAEGYVKAGLAGDPNDYYKISSKNRLPGEALKKVFFGRKVAGQSIATKKLWSIKRDNDGNAITLDDDKTDTGKSWIENDMLCDRWDNMYEGLTDCWVIYRNPEGTPEGKDEYLGVPGYGIYPFSIIE